MSATRVTNSLTLVLLTKFVVVAYCCFQIQLAACEADSVNSMSSSADSQGAGNQGGFGSPKRQYLIAPRIGRSSLSSADRQLAAIWSALEAASMNSPGQVQPNRGYPDPLRSPFYYLVGNSHVVDQRSGLLPQARIGRRSSPMGLLPQPRVGRRSDPFQQQLESQEKVGMAPLSDTYLSDALEALVDVAALLLAEPLAAQVITSGITTIEKPVHRATSFVPRLGKREQADQQLNSDWINLERTLCANYGLDCKRLLTDLKQEYSSDSTAARSWSSIRAPMLEQFMRGAYNNRQPASKTVDDIYQNIGRMKDSDALNVIDIPLELDVQPF